MDENSERKWIIGIIDEGLKSDYWKLLKKAIKEWIAEEHKRLDYYKSVGIGDGKEIEKYNRTVDRIKYLNRLLTINETIVNYHRTWIDQVRDKVEEIFYAGESFVEGFKK